ncbi:MAG: hypothetical protein ACYC41_13405 [Bacillota bacterium]
MGYLLGAFMNWVAANRDALTVIGSWLGAIATLWAVLVALRKPRPQITLTATRRNIFTTNALGVTEKVVSDQYTVEAVNAGMMPVRLTNMGVRLPRGRFLMITPQPGQLTRVLDPFESAYVMTDWAKLEKRGIRRTDIAYAVDAGGGRHWVKVKLWDRITRRLWWTFGRVAKDSAPSTSSRISRPLGPS